MAYTKNAVIEKYDDGTVAVLDEEGVVRIISDQSYEEGQVLQLDVEALDISEAALTEDGTERAMAGDFDAKILSFPERARRGFIKRSLPIAASFALVIVFGIGGIAYADGSVASTVEKDGVSYDINYFHKVIGVHMDDVDEKELIELKQDLRGKKIDEAVEIVEEKMTEIRGEDETDEEMVEDKEISDEPVEIEAEELEDEPEIEEAPEIKKEESAPVEDGQIKPEDEPERPEIDESEKQDMPEKNDKEVLNKAPQDQGDKKNDERPQSEDNFQLGKKDEGLIEPKSDNNNPMDPNMDHGDHGGDRGFGGDGQNDQNSRPEPGQGDRSGAENMGGPGQNDGFSQPQGRQ